jgi:hypothetical protein
MTLENYAAAPGAGNTHDKTVIEPVNDRRAGLCPALRVV